MARQIVWVCFFFVALLSSVFADVFHAAALRGANDAVKRGDFQKAERIYNTLPSNPQLTFNKGYLQSRKGDTQEADRYYRQVIDDRNASLSQKVNAGYNNGNTFFKQGDFKTAIQWYRKGLLLNPHHYNLKYNLELANHAQLVHPRSKQKQQHSKASGQQPPEKNKQNRKDQEKQNAEKTLDAFKQQEQQDLKQSMPKSGESHVEKDW